MKGTLNRVMVSGVVTALLGASIAQAAFADKITTITRTTPIAVETPMIIEENPTTTTTTVRRTIEAPVVLERPMILERREVLAPVVQERRVEILNNALPSSTSTTVTRTTIQGQ
jgi:hypothetical protein